jgi:hypothetical protein
MIWLCRWFSFNPPKPVFFFSSYQLWILAGCMASYNIIGTLHKYVELLSLMWLVHLDNDVIMMSLANIIVPVSVVLRTHKLRDSVNELVFTCESERGSLNQSCVETEKKTLTVSFLCAIYIPTYKCILYIVWLWTVIHEFYLKTHVEHTTYSLAVSPLARKNYTRVSFWRFHICSTWKYQGEGGGRDEGPI